MKYITNFYANMNKQTHTGSGSLQQSHNHLVPPTISQSTTSNNPQHSKVPSANGSQINLPQYRINGGSSEQDHQNVTYTHNGHRDNSMIAFDNGASSMQQISYYDHLSRDDDDINGYE
jgi:hypothetical protein